MIRVAPRARRGPARGLGVRDDFVGDIDALTFADGSRVIRGDAL